MTNRLQKAWVIVSRRLHRDHRSRLCVRLAVILGLLWTHNLHAAPLVEAARERLERLFNRADYPESLIGLFRVEHDYPSVEPPNYLRELSPELFRQETARVAARFEEAVRLTEAGRRKLRTTELCDQPRMLWLCRLLSRIASNSDA